MSLLVFASKLTSSAAVLRTAHLSTAIRMNPLIMTTFAFCRRKDAPGWHASACCSLRRSSVTIPVSSPTTASQIRLEDGPSSFFTSEHDTHFNIKFIPLESGRTLLTFPHLGFLNGLLFLAQMRLKAASIALRCLLSLSRSS